MQQPTKNLCQLILTTQQSNRALGRTFNIAPNTVRRIRQRLIEEHLDWDAVREWDEQRLTVHLLTRRLYYKTFAEPDWSYIYSEMQRVGMTLTRLHFEYAADHRDAAMSQTEFRRRYDKHLRSRGVVMRQTHRPGEAMYVDFSGKRPWITNAETGERRPVELFVATLGASRKTYVQAIGTQQLDDWITCHVKALEYFKGVPTCIVPDNLRSAVSARSRTSGPLINPTYSEFAAHYNTVITPARPRKPQDKAHVELAVRLAQRWVLAVLRNREFFSLDELNRAILELVEQMNDKPMRGCQNKSRNQMWRELDLPAMAGLPVETYTYGHWKLRLRVGKDYHVTFDGRLYSVPYKYVAEFVDLKASKDVIAIFHAGRRIAMHLRVEDEGGISTQRDHQPPAHQAYSADQPLDILEWSRTMGGSIEIFLRQHGDLHRKPAMTMQAGKGLQRLAREFGLDRLQMACHAALLINARSIHSIASVLRSGLEHVVIERAESSSVSDPISHENVRGPDYFDDSIV